MTDLQPAEIAELAEGTLINEAPLEVTGFSLDSRELTRGQFFVALRGSNVDGHRFVPEAFQKGASGALISDESYSEDRFPNVVLVEDVERSLSLLASRYRASFEIPLIGITGSYGKTTTKELLFSCLDQLGRAYRSPGNYNTEYGLPLSLLEMDPEVDYGVFELGLSHPGDMERLSRILRPSTGIVTGLGPAHLGNFRDLTHLAEEKLKMREEMDLQAPLIVNGDSLASLNKGEEMVSKIKGEGRPLFLYGLEGRAEGFDFDYDYSIREIRPKGVKGTAFEILTPEGAFTVRTSLLGRSSAYNALAAVVTALQLCPSSSLADFSEGLRIDPLPGRLRPYYFAQGVVLDDTYNANPPATRNSLALLKEIPAGRKLLVMGDMLELGERAKELHRSLSPSVLEAGVEGIYCYGQLSFHLFEQLRDKPRLSAKHFRDKTALIADLKDDLKNSGGGDQAVLVKGSRKMKMEEVVQALLE